MLDIPASCGMIKEEKAAGDPKGSYFPCKMTEYLKMKKFRCFHFIRVQTIKHMNSWVYIGLNGTENRAWSAVSGRRMLL